MVDTVSAFISDNAITLAILVGMVTLSYCFTVIIGYFANIWPSPDISEEQVLNEVFIDDLPEYKDPDSIKRIFISSDK